MYIFCCRPRRRSGSSIVVLDGELEPVKKHPDDLDDPPDYNMVMMLPGDNGPHREMAVDVPDTFIARNKTPPRYPPPKPILQVITAPKRISYNHFFRFHAFSKLQFVVYRYKIHKGNSNPKLVDSLNEFYLNRSK